MTKNYIEKFNELLPIIISSHDELKIKVYELYTYAAKHGQEFSDWSLLGRFIHVLTDKKIISPVHARNILKKTNPNLVYNIDKKSVSQNKEFKKDDTIILDSIWSEEMTETKKQVANVFDEMKMKQAFFNLVKKALKNNFEKEKIKAAFESAMQ